MSKIEIGATVAWGFFSTLLFLQMRRTDGKKDTVTIIAQVASSVFLVPLLAALLSGLGMFGFLLILPTLEYFGMKENTITTIIEALRMLL